METTPSTPHPSPDPDDSARIEHPAPPKPHDATPLDKNLPVLASEATPVAHGPASTPQKPGHAWSREGAIVAFVGGVCLVYVVFKFFKQRSGWGIEVEPVSDVLCGTPLALNIVAWFLGQGDEEVLKILRRDVLSTAAAVVVLMDGIMPLVRENPELSQLVGRTFLGLLFSALIIQSFKACIEAITVAARRCKKDLN